MMRVLAFALVALVALSGGAKAQVCQVPWIFNNGSGGTFQPDANQINANYAALQKCLQPATLTSLGIVQPDGITISINGQGVISWIPNGAGTGNVVGPTISIANDVALFADTTGRVLKDAGGPPLYGSQPVAPGLIASSISTTAYQWAPPSSVVPGTLAGLQIICADACGTDTPAIIGGGIVTVLQNCNVSTPCIFSPDTGTQSVIWEGCGAGGSGGGASASTSTTNASVGSGAGAGAYFKMWQHGSGAGQTVETGVGAVAAAAGSTGNAGGSTSIGGLFEAGGGQAGIAGGGVSTAALRAPSIPAIVHYDPSMSLIVPIVAESGGEGFYQNAEGWGGAGGSSPLGSGGQKVFITTASKQVSGNAGTGYCAGGGGAVSANNASGTAQAGAPGDNGITLAWELTNP